MEEYVIQVYDDMSTEDRKRLTSLVPVGQEIVRCKDCKYYTDVAMCPCYHETLTKRADWFCADGRRKEQLLEYADQDTAYYANQEVLRPLT